VHDDVAPTADLADLGKFVVTGQAGQSVFREGDADGDLYLVLEGKFDVSVSRRGVVARIASIEAGDFFGEESLLVGGARTYAVQSLTSFKLLKIPPSAFARVIRERPEIAIRMLATLSNRLRDLERHAVDRPVTVDVAEARPLVATYCFLVHTASGREFPVPPHGESMVGRPDREAGFTPDIDLGELDAGRSLSRRHAKIVSGDDGFRLLEEMGVHNGTFLNGKRLEPGVPVPLRDGDELRFGLVEMVFRSR
jgi:hypothetical protein